MLATGGGTGDPWSVQRWAYRQRVGNPVRKLLLTALATMAEANTGYCFASRATLAEFAECSERSVYNHLKDLREAGFIAVRHEYHHGGGRRADAFLLLSDPTITQWPDGMALATIPANGSNHTGNSSEGYRQLRGGHTGNPCCHPTTLDNNPIYNPSSPDGDRGANLTGCQPDGGASDQAREVFEAWIETTGKTGRTRLDAKRRNLIKRALASYPAEDVLDAVRGWRRSPHHRGENTQGTVYNDLGLLLRDAAHIERFRDLERGRTTTAVDLTAQRLAEAQR